MSDTLLSLSGDACSPVTLCSTNIPNANSDLDLDSPTDKNAAWAGIAVVIVVVAVGAAVWFAIRRRRRSRGGHNSVETANPSTRWRGFWGRPRANQPVSESRVEQGVTDELKPQRPISSASNLKRTPTVGSQVDAPPQLKDADYPMVPLHHPQLQSTETFTSIPPESHHPSQNPRDSLASSHRSSGSLSRINMPPPGLGPPVHHSQPPSASESPLTHSASTPPAQT